MEKIFRTGIFIFALSLSLSLSKLSADSKLTFPEAEPEISMDFQDASLKDILKVFSIQSGLNFIASEGVQDRKITLYLDKVPLKKAMDKLFKANNLSYELETDSNIFIVKDWGKLQVETITKVFYLKYATVSSSSLKEESKQIAGAGGGGSGGKWNVEGDAGITKAVKALLSSAGSVIEDFRTNSLIVTDTPSRMNVIAQVIASLDVRVPQVMLEVEMLDVSKNAVDKIGFKFGQTPFKVAITGATASTALGFPFHSWSKTFFTDSDRGTLAINSDSYSAQLDFLRTLTDTKYLARPRLLTLNNETAEIRIATKEAIGVTQSQSGTGGSTGVTVAVSERAETGVVLRITPQINVETGEVTMFIYPKVAEATASTLTSALGSFRDPEERSTKTLVRVRDGETVALGGLIRVEATNIVTKLPILGDIPIIGALFRHRGGGSTDSPKDKVRELLVFITPHIVKERDTMLAQTKKVTLPEREQNTLAGFSREAEINASLNRFEKKKKKK